MKYNNIKAYTVLKYFQTSKELESPKSMTVTWVDGKNTLNVIYSVVWDL